MAKVAAVKIKRMKLADLKPATYNPRTITQKAYDGLSESLKKFGIVQPIVFNQTTGNVVGGHQRLKVLSDEGVEETDVVIVQLSDLEEKTLNITLNNPDIAGDFTEDVNALLAEIAKGSEELFKSLHLDYVNSHIVSHKNDDAGKTNEDALPDIDESHTISKKGRVYKLGVHRLMCGDSTSAKDFATLMQKDKAICMWTDPPYGVDYGTKNTFLNELNKPNHLQEHIKNDALIPENLAAFLADCFKNANKHMVKGGVYYATAPNSLDMYTAFSDALKKADFSIRQVLVWVKSKPAFSRLDYYYRHEPIFYGWSNGGAHKYYGSHAESSVFEVPGEVVCSIHPTMKPVALIERCIAQSSCIGDTVIDMFGGSGATLIACEKTERKARLLELSSTYCDRIRKRYSEFVLGEGCDWVKNTPPIHT
jgi:DNA modification methylase